MEKFQKMSGVCPDTTPESLRILRDNNVTTSDNKKCFTGCEIRKWLTNGVDAIIFTAQGGWV